MNSLAKARPRNLDIEVTARCNLRCAYCYLGEASPTAGDMSIAVADQVIDYTQRLAMHHEPLRGEGRIDWCLFGGEPFLAFGTMQYLVARAESLELPVSVEIFTNGATATPEQVAWCKEHGVTAKRSVGGCPDACALTRSGDYLERYERETALWGDYHLQRRVTVTPATAKFVMASLKWFYARGYWGGLDFVADEYSAWPAEDVAELKAQLSRLAGEFVRQFRVGRVLYNEALQVAAGRLLRQPPVLNLGCGGGRGLQAIAWDGYIVPCHRFLREPRDSGFCGGRLVDLLQTGRTVWGKPLAEYTDSLSRGHESADCRQCPARLSCQHGCMHVAHKTTDVLGSPPPLHCEIQRHYAALALWIDGLLRDIDPRWYDCLATPCEPILESA